MKRRKSDDSIESIESQKSLAYRTNEGFDENEERTVFYIESDLSGSGSDIELDEASSVQLVEDDPLDMESSVDSETDSKVTWSRALREIDSKKLRERASSFDHGFNIPAAVRKHLDPKSVMKKTKKIGKENQKNNGGAKKKKIRGEAKNMKTSTTKSTNTQPKFNRLQLNRKNNNKKNGNKSRKQKSSGDHIDATRKLLGKRRTHTETTSSQPPERALSNMVPRKQSKPDTKTVLSLDWNTRQNSFSDLLLNNVRVVSQNGNKIMLKCMLCGETKRPISVVLGNNSNLKRHVKRVSSICNLLVFQSLKLKINFTFFFSSGASTNFQRAV